MMTTSVPRRNVTTIDDVKRVFKQLLDAEAPKNAMEGDLRSEELDSAVAEVIVKMMDDFVDSVTTGASNTAKHRNAGAVDVGDVLSVLEKDWGQLTNVPDSVLGKLTPAPTNRD